nr:G2/mitotic-specific cyclin C13-1-like [Ipomoea batatas]
MMPGGENRVAMKGSKRSTAFGPVENESAHVLGLPATKKRVVLGDLTNSNTCSTQNTSLRQTQKPKAKQKPGLKEDGDGDESVDAGFYEEDFTPENSQRSAYAPLIYQHLHSMEAEAKRRPLANYMEKVQNDLTPNMRFVLVDWLVEVAEEYRLVADTLYLAVSHIDRFLSFHTLNRKKLQLLGVSSMLVASKYEEIHPPHVEDFVYITDNTFTKEEVVLMEGELLKFLDFEIGNPTTKTFLRIFTKPAQDDSKFSTLEFEFLCSYLAELSLLDYYCVRFLPSLIAAAAIFLARLIILPTLHPWSIALQQYTGYRPYDLKDCVLAIHEMLFSKSEASMVGDKYQDHKYKQVAKMSPPSEIAAHYFQDV